MKILIITPLFQPEPNHLTGLSFAKELLHHGHTVEVLTCFPNYPEGRLYDGYRQKFFMRESLDGINIVRVPLFIDHSRSGLRRIFSYLSFAFTACVPGIFLVKRPDVVFVYQGPATLAFSAIIMKLLWKVPYVLDVQDLWPESVTGSGMLNFRFAENLLNVFCDMTYRMADKIIVLSKGYKKLIQERGVPESKIRIVYNWCDESQMFADSKASIADELFREQNLNIVYAGNMGRLQALESVLYAAEIIAPQSPDIRIFFVGDGVDTDRLKQLAVAKNITNVSFIPRQPSDRIGAILQKADALLLHLKDDPLCRVGIPQKTQAYMAAGKPVIMAVKGEAADLVPQEGLGLHCEPENPADIANAISNLAAMPEAERRRIGAVNQAFYNKELSFHAGVDRIVSIFCEAIVSNK